MRAAFDNLAVFQNQNLIGAAYCREPVCDDESRTPTSKRSQTILNQRFALAVETGGCFIKDQQLGIGENGARDRNALALSAGKLYSALADDRLVLLLEFFDKLFTVRNAAHRLNLIGCGVRIRESNVLGNGSVEQKVVLHDNSEVRTEVAQAQRAQVFAIDSDRSGQRMIKIHCETDERALA